VSTGLVIYEIICKSNKVVMDEVKKEEKKKDKE
jgi:hypothetical protein